ncbi:MAG: hypothetical protein ACMUJM_04195 [bacterium]
MVEIIPCFYRYYNKIKIICKEKKEISIPNDKIITQRDYNSYLSKANKKNPIMEGYKYLEYLDKVPHPTYGDIAEEFNISKARVSQMIALVTRLPKEITGFIVNNDGKETFTERQLRPLTLLKSDKEKIERFWVMVDDMNI